MLRREGGGGQGPGRPARSPLDRRRRHPRRPGQAVAGDQRHGAAGRRPAGRPGVAPVAEPRRRVLRGHGGSGGGTAMRQAHEVAEVRRAERALMARVPEGALMQRAAAGLAAACAGLLGQVYGSKVVVLAGTGDNGGDALYAGALLARRGAVVTAISTGSKAHPGGSAALRDSGGRVTDAATDGAADLIDGADLIIDGMLGIGGRGGLREPGATLAALAAAARALVVAVDLPSGIDADTGEVPGAAVRADATVTFGTWKPGLLIDPGATHAGAAELIDIGLGPCLRPASVAALQASDVKALLPGRPRNRTSTAGAYSASWPAAT